MIFVSMLILQKDHRVDYLNKQELKKIYKIFIPDNPVYVLTKCISNSPPLTKFNVFDGFKVENNKSGPKIQRRIPKTKQHPNVPFCIFTTLSPTGLSIYP